MPQLKAPEGMTDVSFDGQNYTVGDDGLVDVPQEAMLTLYAFGFAAPPAKLPEPEPEPEPKPKGKAKN